MPDESTQRLLDAYKTPPPNKAFPREQWTLRRKIGCATGILFFLLFATLLVPMFPYTEREIQPMKAASNLKQIVGLLISYAADNNGNYPDSSAFTSRDFTTSNQAFRQLFIEEVTKDERIFGCPRTPHVPDGNIGTEPHYNEALQPGENHWALVAGLTTISEPNEILIMEAPDDPAWPPRWRADSQNVPIPQTYSKPRRILVARNDGTTAEESLAPGPGLQPLANPALTATPRRILNIERPLSPPAQQPR